QKYQLHIKAELSNITDLKPGPDYEYKEDEVEMPNSRGTTMLSMKCQFCNSWGSIDLEPKTLKPYTIENSGQFSPFLMIEGRGWEPVEFIPWGGFEARGPESGTVFSEVDLTEKEWTDYDEKQGESVEIMEFDAKITKGK
ncbi:UPF0587 protein C1orf123, partial [Gorgonomyces haynaldii]